MNNTEILIENIFFDENVKLFLLEFFKWIYRI